MDMPKLTEEAKLIIKENKKQSLRKLQDLIYKKVEEKYSPTTISNFKKELKNNKMDIVEHINGHLDKNMDTIKKTYSPRKIKTKDSIQFPRTSNQLVELLERHKDNGKAEYLLKQYKDPGKNKTLLMHTIEFVIDHFQ